MYLLNIIINSKITDWGAAWVCQWEYPSNVKLEKALMRSIPWAFIVTWPIDWIHANTFQPHWPLGKVRMFVRKLNFLSNIQNEQVSHMTWSARATSDKKGGRVMRDYTQLNKLGRDTNGKKIDHKVTGIYSGINYATSM